MSKSSRRHGKAALAAGALALIASATAHAAPPKINYHYFTPENPRTATEVKFWAYGTDPEGKTVQKGWDFAGGSSFSLTSAESVAHTFDADGVHWLTARLQDADGEATDVRYPMATHPENWAPTIEIADEIFDHIRTYSANLNEGTKLTAYASDDSPASGITYSWDLDNDGTFGDGVAVDGHPEQILANNFTEAKTYPVKVKANDGQGETATAAATVRAHSANEAPFPYEYYDGAYDNLTFLQNDPEGSNLYISWSDDFTSYSGFSWAWEIDGTPVADSNAPSVDIPAGLSLGEHTAKVVATDDGMEPKLVGETMTYEKGTPVSKAYEFKFTIVAAFPEHVAGIHVSSYRGDVSPTAPTYRTLENLSLYAGFASSSDPVVWDLDNDGEFDDSSLYETFFSVANKGTYKVRAKSGSSVLEKTIVVDKGPDYAPAPTTGGGGSTGGGSTGGGSTTNPPVATPEQVKAAMVTFLTKETAELLQLVGGLNKKGIDPAKAILVLGTLGPDTLPNGGTGAFNVYDKAPKLARAAAVKKPKLLGSTKVTIAKGQSKKVTVKLNKKGKALLKKKGKVKLTVQATLTDALTGASVKQVKTYTFKVKKKRGK